MKKIVSVALLAVRACLSKVEHRMPRLTCVSGVRVQQEKIGIFWFQDNELYKLVNQVPLKYFYEFKI